VTAAAEAFEAARRRPGEPVAVVGPSGAGKSRAAAEIARLAESGGMFPIVVSPPSGALDAGALVVSRVVQGLGGRLQPSSTWQQALRTTDALLRESSDRLVVICDEPNQWTARGGYFGRRAEDAVDLLLGPSTTWSSIVCEQAAGGYRAVPLPPSPVAALRDRPAWGELADAASLVAERPDAAEFATPLGQRLAAALTAWGPAEPPPAAQPVDLASRLAQALVNRRHGRSLWALWQRLSLERLRLDDELLTKMGADDLTPLARDTLRHVFLDGAGRLHDLLRRIPEERPVDPEMESVLRHDAHELLFEHHYERLRALAEAGDPSAADHAAEALHHAGELADQERLDLIRVQLSDQLNALGARLQDIQGDHHSAAAMFLRAIQFNGRDGYSHHGRARSLDMLGHNAEEVESEYRTALSLDPLQLSWHAHYVSFLADLGRPDEARRAWAQAESTMLAGEEYPEVYDSLHASVAASLIALGELDFASYVLDGVPGVAQDAEYRRLRNLLAGRIAADEEGAFVPAPRSGGLWWRDGPHVLPPRDTEGRELITWAAGRIEHVDEEGVHIHVAQVDPLREKPEPGWTVIAPEIWARRCLDDVAPHRVRVGRFVEIGRYRSEEDDGRTAIRLVPIAPLQEGRHRPLDPGRWAGH
jgi:tetratricopeptide (TPR) repeat protein